jgi:hypothetical protein
MIGTHQQLIYVDVNLLGGNRNTIKKTKETLSEASRRAEKTAYMFVSCHQIAEQNQNIKKAKKLFKNMEKLKYLGMIITNQNCIHEEIKRRINSENACYHSFQIYCLPVSYLKM